MQIWGGFLQFLIPGGAEWLALTFTENFLRLGGWVLLGVFLPALIWIAVHLKHSRSGTRLDTLSRTYDIANERYYQIYRNFGRHTFSASHYFLVMIITALCFFSQH